MSITAKITVKNQDLLDALKGFFSSILELEEICALLVPQQLPMKKMIMPNLITDPKHLDGVDPLAPAFPMNAAKIVSRLTRKSAGGKVAAVLRPCEIRAYYELVKLNQGAPDELVIIGFDCLGAYSNRDYARFVDENMGQSAVAEGIDLASACRTCEYPIPYGADILIGYIGIDPLDHFLVQAQSPKGEELLRQLNLPETDVPEARAKALQELIAQRSASRDEMFAETQAATNTLEKLTQYLGSCINCYNCRVACPVCYCKECVFVTDVFNHDPVQYLQWAKRKGGIKMPTDTVFYHLTRMVHMSTACVGCGQCSNACPNDIAVMELFRTIAHRTQTAFDYEPGRSIDDKPPLSVFREDEFEEVVGIADAAS